MKRNQKYEGLLSKLFIATGDKKLHSMKHEILYKCGRTAMLTGKSDVTSFKTHNFTTTELNFRKRDLSHEKNSFATEERKKNTTKKREKYTTTKAFLK